MPFSSSCGNEIFGKNIASLYIIAEVRLFHPVSPKRRTVEKKTVKAKDVILGETTPGKLSILPLGAWARVQAESVRKALGS
jgi:hypothetical protein